MKETERDRNVRTLDVEQAVDREDAVTLERNLLQAAVIDLYGRLSAVTAEAVHLRDHLEDAARCLSAISDDWDMLDQWSKARRHRYIHDFGSRTWSTQALDAELDRAGRIRGDGGSSGGER